MFRNVVGHRNKKLAPALWAAAAVFLSASVTDTARAAPSGTLRNGTYFDLQSWNPQIQTNTIYVRPVYEGLVEMAPDGTTIQPRLAESWMISPTDATFKLRKGVTFHDGTPFNADALVANIENVKKAANRWADTVAGIKKVVKIDDHTVRFEFDQPNPALLYTLSQAGLYMVSPKSIADGTWLTAPAGTGPYVYDEKASVSGSKYIFTFFDKYYAPDEVGPANLELHYLPDGPTRFNALLTGQVDAAEGDPTQIAQAEAAGLSNHPWTVLRYHMIFLDRKGVFGDPLVRKAMCMAIPREQINAARYGGLATIAPQRFDQGDPAHVPGLTGYADDIEGAKALMAQAGNPKVSFKFPTYESQKLLGQLLKESYAKIGIEVELLMMPNNEYFQTFYSGKYPLLYNSMSAEYGGMFNYYPFRFAKAGKANTFNVDPPAELDDAFRSAINAPVEKQTALLQTMATAIHDQALDCGYLDIAHVVHFDPKRITSLVTTKWEPSALRYKDVRIAD